MERGWEETERSPSLCSPVTTHVSPAVIQLSLRSDAKDVYTRFSSCLFFFMVFTVDIPRVFVFIYDHWFKIGGNNVKSTVHLTPVGVLQHLTRI